MKLRAAKLEVCAIYAKCGPIVLGLKLRTRQAIETAAFGHRVIVMLQRNGSFHRQRTSFAGEGHCSARVSPARYWPAHKP